MSYGPEAGSDNYFPGTFYTITAIASYTNVQIRAGPTGPVIHSFPWETLWETITIDGGNSVDFTGYLIQADQPVLVMSGHGDAVITDGPYEGQDQDGYICDVMPSTEQLGTEYTTFPVVFGVPEGCYRVRILITDATTVVIIEEHDVNTVLNAGDFIEVHHTDSLTSFQVIMTTMIILYQKRIFN